MKISFIGQKGIPAKTGGIEAHVHALSTQLAKKGFDVTVYARKHYTDPKVKNVDGVKVKFTKGVQTKHFDAISHVFTSLIDAMKNKTDIIHLHGIGPALLIWIPIVFSPKTKILFTFHCKDYEHQKWGVFARTMLKFGEWMGNTFADQIITVSKTLTEYTKKTYKRTAMYIPNGVTVGNTKKADIITKKWGLSGNDYILSVSRLVRHKGIHSLIKAYNKIETDKKLVIVGDSSFTGKYVKELKSLAKKNKNIIFTGKQTGETLQELYSNACVFVQPSESEGLSIALLEALGYGLSVIASDIPENKEVVEKVGMLFENKNVSALQAQLEMFLHQKKQNPLQKSANKMHVKTHYNWDTIAAVTAQAYRVI